MTIKVKGESCFCAREPLVARPACKVASAPARRAPASSFARRPAGHRLQRQLVAVAALPLPLRPGRALGSQAERRRNVYRLRASFGIARTCPRAHKAQRARAQGSRPTGGNNHHPPPPPALLLWHRRACLSGRGRVVDKTRAAAEGRKQTQQGAPRVCCTGHLLPLQPPTCARADRTFILARP